MRRLGLWAGAVILLAVAAASAAAGVVPRNWATVVTEPAATVAQTVPEPGILLLIGCGLVAAGLVGSRRYRG